VEGSSSRPQEAPKDRAAGAFNGQDDATMGASSETMADSLEEFVRRAMIDYEGALVGYASGILHDVERAREVVQDTFVRLCRQDVGKVRDGLKTWLFTVCRNRALDVLRKDRRLVEADEGRLGRLAPPDRALDLSERLAELGRYLDRLSPNQREVILLKFQQGMSYKEISEVTGLSGGNIGFLIHVGLKRLREMLPDDLLDNLGEP
jgi:RNA polymerase sigma-70 factor (ECF subfamily)